MVLSNDCIWRIKYFVLIIIYSNIAFINHIYIKIDHYHVVEIDNDFKLDPYENETIYQKKSKLKPITIIILNIIIFHILNILMNLLVQIIFLQIRLNYW